MFVKLAHMLLHEPAKPVTDLNYYYYYYIVHKVQIRNITQNPTSNNIEQQTAFTNTEKKLFNIYY